MPKVTFWKFVDHPIDTTPEQAAKLAERIESGDFVPCNSHGERYYKSMGWCYNIGRKPYLIQHSHGDISRGWAASIKELRKALYLTKADKVVPDPFYKELK